MTNPVIVNHTSGTLITPALPGEVPFKLSLSVVLPFCAFIYAIGQNPTPENIHKNLPIMLGSVSVAMIVMALVLRIWMQEWLMQRCATSFMRSWKTLSLKNPTGVIEGVSTIQRFSTKWTLMSSRPER
jgi:hypothetical protein